jgi:anti-sigma28 factor (negative regulator of flagellin synthesis)
MKTTQRTRMTRIGKDAPPVPARTEAVARVLGAIARLDPTAIRQERVDALRAAIAEGCYRIDLEAVARAWLVDVAGEVRG